jgi:acetylglutamate kinase
MQATISIVKIGGATLESTREMTAFCDAFTALEGDKILVHGGGKIASRLGERLGSAPKMVDGRRITDAATLEIAVMSYAGWANKTLVSRLQAMGCPALGVCGADADLIRAVKRPVKSIDFGFVGDVDVVNQKNFRALLDLGMVPVCCALTHDGNGQLLNTNADTIAAEIAVAMGQAANSRLLYCFDKPGVLYDVDDDQSVIPELDPQACEELKKEGRIAAGMLPKLHNCFNALNRGVSEVRIGAPSMLGSGKATFTKICL